MSDSDFRTPDAREEADLAATRDEAVAGPDPGEMDEDAMQAAEGLTASAETAANYRESVERGANQQGEGRIP